MLHDEDDAQDLAALSSLATALGPNSTNINILAGVARNEGRPASLNLNTVTKPRSRETVQTTGYTVFLKGVGGTDDVVDVLLSS